MQSFKQKLVELYHRHREAVDYLFWGVMATALNIILLPVFMALGMGATAANLLDLCICILFAYCTNRRFVFRSHTRGGAAVREFLSFLGGRAITGIIDQIFIMITVDHYGAAAAAGLAESVGLFDVAVWTALWAAGCKVISNVVVIILNYIFSKLFIFKNKG